MTATFELTVRCSACRRESMFSGEKLHRLATRIRREGCPMCQNPAGGTLSVVKSAVIKDGTRRVLTDNR